MTPVCIFTLPSFCFRDLKVNKVWPALLVPTAPLWVTHAPFLCCWAKPADKIIGTWQTESLSQGHPGKEGPPGEKGVAVSTPRFTFYIKINACPCTEIANNGVLHVFSPASVPVGWGLIEPHDLSKLSQKNREMLNCPDSFCPVIDWSGDSWLFVSPCVHSVVTLPLEQQYNSYI